MGTAIEAHPKSEKTNAPPMEITCQVCGRANHFETMCQSKDKTDTRMPSTPNSTREPNQNNAAFDSFENLCVLTNPDEDQTAHGISLDHHLYNHLNDCWVRQTSQPQPFISLKTTIHPDDYKALGFKPIVHKPKTTQLSAMADTGCQSCLASMSVIRRLGLSEKDLIPVKTRMHAANNSGIEILWSSNPKILRTIQSWTGTRDQTDRLRNK